jgi:hypothetical protein
LDRRNFDADHTTPLVEEMPMSRKPKNLYRRHETISVCDMKRRQSAKIREIRTALVASGVVGLDNQARALGTSRSTAWTILKGNHKASGLSAALVNRILGAPQLPALVRAKLLEYAADKAAGRYGHSVVVRSKFVRSLTEKSAGELRLESVVSLSEDAAA